MCFSTVIWTKTCCHFTFLSCSYLLLCPKINTLPYQGIKYFPSLLQFNRRILGYVKKLHIFCQYLEEKKQTLDTIILGQVLNSLWQLSLYSVLQAYCLVTHVFLVYYTMARMSIATHFFINFLNNPSLTPVIAEDSFVITVADHLV